MQRTQHALAVTLHVRPYRETSVLLDTWLREQGRYAVIARGVRVAGKARRHAELSPLALNLLELAGSGAVLSLRSHDTQRQFPLSGPLALRSALYLNELLLRLLPEHDPHPDLFDQYIDTLGDWSAHPEWTAIDYACCLRRFECALLDELGYGLVWDMTVDGEALDPDASYQVDPEQGVLPTRRGLDWPMVDGATLQALAASESGIKLGSKALRDVMRAVLRHRLGGRTLRAWLQ